MSESKPFSGPWFVRDRVVYHKTFGEIATVWPSEYPNAGDMEANARIIAAAPDMLEALKAAMDEEMIYTGAIHETLEASGLFLVLMAKIRAAVAKATGAA
jgi:hypothetical protein